MGIHKGALTEFLAWLLQLGIVLELVDFNPVNLFSSPLSGPPPKYRCLHHAEQPSMTPCRGVKPSSSQIPPSLIKLHRRLSSSRSKINGIHPTSSVVLPITRRNRLGSSFIDLPNRSKVQGPRSIACDSISVRYISRSPSPYHRSRRSESMKRMVDVAMSPALSTTSSAAAIKFCLLGRLSPKIPGGHPNYTFAGEMKRR